MKKNILYLGVLMSVISFILFGLKYDNSIFLNLNNYGVVQKTDEISERGNHDVDDQVILMAVGDVMLARTVEAKMVQYGDWQYPFLKVYEKTSQADILFGNLETTIMPGKIAPSGSFSFRTDPQAVQGLQLAGFDVLSLANNHIMNFGKKGLESTMQHLQQANIAHVGAGLSEQEIFMPVIKEVKGMKFGFLAYSYSNEVFWDTKSQNKYGVAELDVEKMKQQVGDLSKQVDVVIVSMHNGWEYQTSSNQSQKVFARAAIDAGAKLVIGHHPHVVQEMEKYQDGYIFYSLGNFVFDQMWSQETRLGVLAEVIWRNKEITAINLFPVKIEDYCQPQYIQGAEQEKILQRMSVVK